MKSIPQFMSVPADSRAGAVRNGRRQKASVPPPIPKDYSVDLTQPEIVNDLPEDINLQGEIVLFPDPILTTPCNKVPLPLPQHLQEELVNFVKRMMAHCIARNGLGLAANQLGEAYQIFIMRMEGGAFLVCLNPEIVDSGKEEVFVKEGCLSHPGFQVLKKRKAIVTMKYYGLDGRCYTEVFKRKEAYVVQHEILHLRGEPFLPENPHDTKG